ncbi:uncharacterized protein MELLADRAFT_103717 [Melampsora larici-populina 98AG31]|uniref:Uncharacterized protein n=1 Tax=Melampsora larici-populina (strain 98AG31 / pathotype 3-4-7) TaxID=747676 RepID=F4RCQ8_MELLP|nr:uncharacterized protein MELLADRAFT_103717 [Melampsora larici-populina 98AG31]EGG09676.1 hypothetical protein MELLADRAFT_103717 [Melampsora larici-populina 98AG31]
MPGMIKMAFDCSVPTVLVLPPQNATSQQVKMRTRDSDTSYAPKTSKRREPSQDIDSDTSILSVHNTAAKHKKKVAPLPKAKPQKSKASASAPTASDDERISANVTKTTLRADSDVEVVDQPRKRHKVEHPESDLAKLRAYYGKPFRKPGDVSWFSLLLPYYF